MSALGANATYFEQQRYTPAPARKEQGLTNWNYIRDPRGVVDLLLQPWPTPISEPRRKPVGSEGRNLQYMAVIPSFSNEARAELDEQISCLKRDYGFADGEVVTDFLVSHSTIRTLLKDAVPQLRATFGADRIFNLEVARDEDGSETMYAVAIWPEDVGRASEALHKFLENWWLRRMNAATSDLAFIYKLV